MKASYSNRQSRPDNKFVGHLALAWSNSASRAESDEAYKVLEAVQKAQQHLDERPTAVILRIEHEDEASTYNHVTAKRVFSVRTQYKLIGRMKPRQIPRDE